MRLCGALVKERWSTAISTLREAQYNNNACTETLAYWVSDSGFTWLQKFATFPIFFLLNVTYIYVRNAVLVKKNYCTYVEHNLITYRQKDSSFHFIPWFWYSLFHLTTPCHVANFCNSIEKCQNWPRKVASFMSGTSSNAKDYLISYLHS